jgi:hypothetical protein
LPSALTWHSAKPVPRIPRFGHFVECFCHSTRQMPSLPSAAHSKVTKNSHFNCLLHSNQTNSRYISHASYISQIYITNITCITYITNKFTSITTSPSQAQVHHSFKKNHKCITTISMSQVHHNHK